MERTQHLPRQIIGLPFAIGLIWAMHFFGLLGSFWNPMIETLQNLTPFHSFIDLTPLNLVVMSSLLLAFHPNWHRQHIAWVGLAFLTGYGIEVIGVHTSMVFGGYSYGEVLGWKLMGVPLTIGLNWMALVYSCGTLLKKWKSNIWIKAATMATLLTALDFLIEPVAFYWGFWSWETVYVPIQNYIAWWVISFLLSIAWQKAFTEPLSKVGASLWWAQVFFFLGNNLLIYT